MRWGAQDVALDCRAGFKAQTSPALCVPPLSLLVRPEECLEGSEPEGGAGKGGIFHFLLHLIFLKYVCRVHAIF